MSLRLVTLLIAAASLAGCSTFMRPEADFKGPTTARPVPPADVQPTTGAIYQANAGSYRPLFEDRRARYIGDTLIIQINEKTQANSKQGSSADRSASASATLPAISGIGGKSFKAVDASASSAATFDGNLESMPNTYLYTDDQARAVHVATSGIIELLDKGYKAVGLLK